MCTHTVYAIFSSELSQLHCDQSLFQLKRVFTYVPFFELDFVHRIISSVHLIYVLGCYLTSFL